MVNHSNHGEFAYRDGNWKLVFRMSKPKLEKSRGLPTVAELYNLKTDIAEKENLAEKHPQIVKRMTSQLEKLIAAGTSRPGQKAANDTAVRFDISQQKRWGPKLERE